MRCLGSTVHGQDQVVTSGDFRPHCRDQRQRVVFAAEVFLSPRLFDACRELFELCVTWQCQCPDRRRNRLGEQHVRRLLSLALGVI